jgi:hypothetical protein
MKLGEKVFVMGATLACAGLLLAGSSKSSTRGGEFAQLRKLLRLEFQSKTRSD